MQGIRDKKQGTRDKGQEANLNLCQKMQADEYLQETSFKGKDTAQIRGRYDGDREEIPRNIGITSV
jgi:hypothetical protein